MSKLGVIAILYSQTAADLIPRLLQSISFGNEHVFIDSNSLLAQSGRDSGKLLYIHLSAFPHCLSLVSGPICSGCVGWNQQRANPAMDN